VVKADVQITSNVNTLTYQYEAFGTSIHGLLHLSASQLPMKDSREVAKRGSLYLQNYLPTFEKSIRDASAEAVEMALNQAEIDYTVMSPEVFRSVVHVDINEQVESVIDLAVQDVSAQLSRDLYQAIEDYNYVAGVAKIRFTRGMPMNDIRKAAAVEISQADFQHLDQLGRRRKAIGWMKTRMNMLLRKLYNEVYLYAASVMDRDIAELVYPDPDHRYNGLKFSISGLEEKYPSYHVLRQEILHPNSKALVSKSPMNYNMAK